MRSALSEQYWPSRRNELPAPSRDTGRVRNGAGSSLRRGRLSQHAGRVRYPEEGAFGARRILPRVKNLQVPDKDIHFFSSGMAVECLPYLP